MTERFLLAIETSCDDTAVAVIGEFGTVKANLVSSQDAEHAPYHGVVPEIASRAHLGVIDALFQRALRDARMTLNDLEAVAVTYGPGLVGSLLVGVNFAKGLSLASGLPLIAVNHIRAHVRALFIEHKSIPHPALALIVSGGHTHLFRLLDNGDLELLVKTRDDALGEAYDKLAKMLGLSFPGGPQVDRRATKGDPNRYGFSQPKLSDGSLDYSFSGFKTAALRHIEADPRSFQSATSVDDLCASFQNAVLQHLLHRVALAIKQHDVQALLLGGGVACNSELRRRATALADEHQLAFKVSQPKLCTDNAAMVGAEAWLQIGRGQIAALDLAPAIKLKAYEHYTPLTRGA